MNPSFMHRALISEEGFNSCIRSLKPEQLTPDSDAFEAVDD